jgi:hypothetical protein
MRSRLAWALALAIVLGAVSVASASASPVREPVHITAFTDFVEGADPFLSDIEGCGSGLVDNGPTNFAGGQHFGVFAGFKVFECAGPGDDGFILRQNARFDDTGSTGTWSVVQAWGSVAGMRGSGKLVGELVPGGIEDVFVGSAVFP